MNRRNVAVFAALSILVAALAAASVAYRVLSAEASGKREASADFERLAVELSYIRSAADLADEGIRARLVEHYKACPSLLLISIYERGAGLRWKIPSRSVYLPASENQEPFPKPQYPDRSTLLISAPIKGDTTGRLAVDALYSTLSQATVFLAFRDALLVLAAYLAAAAVFLATSAASRRNSAARAVPRADANTSSSEGASEPAASSGPSAYPPAEEDFAIPELATTEAPHADASGLYAPVSRLGWESYLTERLDAELARSASFEQDLSLLFVVYDGMNRDSKTYPTVAKSLLDFFTFRDLAFERGEDGFSVILPNIDIDSALRMAEEYLKKLTFLLRDYRDPLEFLPVFMGLSSRAGRLVDSARIDQEASAAIQKAREDRDSHIVAFRPDPDKYRLFLSSKGC
jgi:GGDEF domain-containing protein